MDDPVNLDCDDVVRAWRGATGTSGADGAPDDMSGPLRDHVAGCPGCAAMLSLGRTPEGSPSPAEPSWGALEALLGEEDRPHRRAKSWPTWVRWSVLMAIGVASGILVGWMTPRPDLSAVPLPRLGVEVGLSLLLAAVLFGGVLGELHGRLVRGAALAVGVGVALLFPWIFVLAPPPHGGHPASLGGLGPDLWPRAIQCLSFGAIVGSPLWIAVAWLGRAPRASLRGRVVVAVGIGLWGLLALQLHCPLTARAHLALGHALLPLVLGLGIAAATWLAARRERSLSRRPLIEGDRP